MGKTELSLPFKVGDTIWFIRPTDCKSGECKDVDTEICEYSAFHSPTKEVVDCCMSRLIVDWTEVDHIKTDDWGDEIEITVNEYIDQEDIFATQEEALVAAEAMDYKMLFVVDKDGEE